jgi:selenocysteine-specific elongation factor
MHVIGTAGHVDHGKSTLVEALSGIDPDRLREEKERQMTIDLGFAWLTLDVGGEPEEVGIVDVPGHRDFIENMLAGVGGIDLALFVVAADEGVMPQTREHLAILDPLEVPGGVVALTKTDLVDDPDWLELVTLDLGETLAGTVLKGAPIIPISARTGGGLDVLRAALAEGLAGVAPRPDSGRPRLAIDRVFSLSGFGTVVTGTLQDGSLRTGDSVVVQPAGLEGRVRGLQTHKTQRDVAYPGSRVAVNVGGISAGDIQRGDVLAAPGAIRGTLLLDASYRHLPDAPVSLRHNMEVKLFVGAAEVMARVRLLGTRSLPPGEEGWLQLALEEPVAVSRGDRFILRRPSPGETLGGGRVVDPHPGRRHRRFRPEVIARLQTLAEGSAADRLYQTLQQRQPLALAALIQASGQPADEASAAWDELLADDRALLIGNQVLTTAYWQRQQDRVRETLAAFHADRPLRLGMPREELRSRLGLAAALFNPLTEALLASGEVVAEGFLFRLPAHAIRFSPAQEEAVARLLQRFASAGVNSPSVKESREAVGDAVYDSLVDLGRLRPLNDDVVYRAEEYDDLVSRVTALMRKEGRVNTGQVRDLLDTSRKYTIALLEHLDHIKLTRRVGDERELRRGSRESA